MTEQEYQIKPPLNQRVYVVYEQWEPIIEVSTLGLVEAFITSAPVVIFDKGNIEERLQAAQRPPELPV